MKTKPPSENAFSATNRPADRYFVWIAKGMVVLLGVVTFTLVLRPRDQLISRPLTEDGYYSLAVARNIALGRGITIDGHQRTDGFQPLFTFVTVPAFWLANGDRFSAIRYVLGLHWLFYLLTAWLLGLIARDALGRAYPGFSQRILWFTVLLYAASSWIFMVSFNGLETGCLVFMYALVWRYYQRGKHETRAGLAGLGVLLGLLVLARIDSVFFVILISIFQLVRPRNSAVKEKVVRFVIVGGTAFLVSLPWWAYNVFDFGSLMPISGKAEESFAFSLERFSTAGGALLHVLVPYLYLGESMFEGTTATLVRLLVVAVLAWFVWKILKDSKNQEAMNSDGTIRRTTEVAITMAATMVFLLFWYTVSSYASWFYVRYITPLVLVSTLCWVLVLTRLTLKFRRLSVLALLFIAGPVCLITYMLSSGGVSNEYFQQQYALVERYVPPTDLVGAHQTGTLGYCRDNVVNLDGKVNFEIHRPGFNMADYLRERGIRWLCDWPWSTVPSLTGSDPESHGWKLIARSGRFVLYHYLPDDHK